MKAIYLILLFFLFKEKIFAQKRMFDINGNTFLSITKTVVNDLETKDTLLIFYRIKQGKKQYLFTHYLYRLGVDCNNEFKDIGTIKITNDSIILKTVYTQKAHDPIPEMEKKIYKVKRDGSVLLVFNKTFSNGKWSADKN